MSICCAGGGGQRGGGNGDLEAVVARTAEGGHRAQLRVIPLPLHLLPCCLWAPRRRRHSHRRRSVTSLALHEESHYIKGIKLEAMNLKYGECFVYRAGFAGKQLWSLYWGKSAPLYFMYMLLDSQGRGNLL